VLVALRKLANLATGKDSGICGLEIVLYNETAIIHQAVLVNDVEDLLINIADTRCDQESDI